MAELRDAYKAIKLLQDALSKSKADTASLRNHFKAQLEQYQLQVHALRDELAAKPLDETKSMPCQHHGLGIEAAERKHAIEVQALRDELALAHRYREEALAELAQCRATLVAHQNASQNSLKERQATHEAEVLGLQQTNAIVLLEKHVLQDEVTTLRTVVAGHVASKEALEDHTRLLLLQQHTLQEQLALTLEDRDAVRRVSDALQSQVQSLKQELDAVAQHDQKQAHRIELQDASSVMTETDKVFSDVPATLAALLREKVKLQSDVAALRAFTHDHVQTTLASVQAHLCKEWAAFQLAQVAPLKTMAADLCTKVEGLEHAKVETATSLRAQWKTLRAFCQAELAAFAEEQSDAMVYVVAQVANLQASRSPSTAPELVDDTTGLDANAPWSTCVPTLLEVVGPFQKLVQCLSQLQSLLKTMAHHGRALEDWSDAVTHERIWSMVLLAQRLVSTAPPHALGETVAACHRAVHDQLYGWHEVQSNYVGPTPVFGIHSPEVDHIMTSWSASVAEQQAAKLWLSYVATGDIDGHEESSHFRFRSLSDDVKDAFLVLIVPVLKQRQGDHLHVRLRRHRPSTVSDETRWDLLLEVGALMRQSLSSESDDPVPPSKEAPSKLFLAIQRRLTELQQHP
ncbi:hypothetical protein SPRG_10240 [Saprolegnia parasitica CBS 223.65]|uniref:Uncharacterized protein n=1 Tax=Saprolegnia parasitica (strain CBS 223.65) TaxID=695850 RepID=A0A067CDW4_SAPPC|nr:hypothetical protein SPRG_10240 [Saprolegnia parasitica CBS 223.65]KDO24706.1 hypothetical protein SPRG_10240 [Saprolegnia parasitica CBS 223.65]|eukprot:XP_012204586.1 hypothetical protein SPRG_10240 [Saprolegnia parasitica CBS 223.65]